jgi:hypothetical protein
MKDPTIGGMAMQGHSSLVRSVLGALLLAVLAIPELQADSIDPHVLFAAGGNTLGATDITTGGVQVTLSLTGGGIFVFHNATGKDLLAIDASVQFPVPSFPIGFGVSGTIFALPGSGQQTSFQSFLLDNVTCAGLSSAAFSCLKMEFGLIPGPLILPDQNFVLDFDAPGPTGYTGVDALVASGTYTGGTDSSNDRSGEWPTSGAAVVTPVSAVPEPETFGILLISAASLAICHRRRRNTAH